jgi:hypothetical protein
VCGLWVLGDEEEEEEEEGGGEVAFEARPTRTRTTTRWPDRDAIPEIKQKRDEMLRLPHSAATARATDGTD